jgi:hypothetical protein
MHKLSGKSIDKLYKSCSVFHQESNKIGFFIFLNFIQFSMDFLNSSKTANTIEDSLYNKVPGKIQYFTDMPSVYT